MLKYHFTHSPSVLFLQEYKFLLHLYVNSFTLLLLSTSQVLKFILSPFFGNISWNFLFRTSVPSILLLSRHCHSIVLTAGKVQKVKHCLISLGFSFFYFAYHKNFFLISLGWQAKPFTISKAQYNYGSFYVQFMVVCVLSLLHQTIHLFLLIAFLFPS